MFLFFSGEGGDVFAASLCPLCPGGGGDVLARQVRLYFKDSLWFGTGGVSFKKYSAPCEPPQSAVSVGLTHRVLENT